MKHLLTYFKNMDPTSSENVGSNYSLGQEWYNTVTGDKFYHKSDGVWVKSITSTSSLIIEVTYSELDALKTNSLLVPGRVYLLTDYMTRYEQPVSGDIISSGVVEPLYITATGVNTLSNICMSKLYPQDIVYYEITGVIDDNYGTQGFDKGVIYRRIDTIRNNDIGTDWRHIKYRRYALNVNNTYATGNNYSREDVVNEELNIYICVEDDPNSATLNSKKWIQYIYANGQYRSLSQTEVKVHIYSSYSPDAAIIPVDSADYEDYPLFPIIDGSDYYSEGDIYNNTITRYTLSNNVIYGRFNNNTITTNRFTNNNIVNAEKNYINFSFTENNIGSWIGNTISSDTYDLGVSSNHVVSIEGNHITSSFRKNFIRSNNFKYNTFKGEFSANTITGDWLYNNIGYYVLQNLFTGMMSNNSIRYYFMDNLIRRPFHGCTIGSGFRNWDIPETTASLVNWNFSNDLTGSGFSLPVIADTYIPTMYAAGDSILVRYDDEHGDTIILGQPEMFSFRSTQENVVMTVQTAAPTKIRVDWGDTTSWTSTLDTYFNAYKTYTGKLNTDEFTISIGGGNITSLVVEGNLTYFNPFYFPSTLASLGLPQSQLTSFDPSIALPNSLTYLWLQQNQLTSFDPTLPLPNSLIYLDLNSNQLTSFDTTLPLPDSLQDLYLNGNQLTEFNPINSLPSNLQMLNLNGNQLTLFDPNILPITIESLNLNGNQLTSFDTSVSLPNLTVLDLNGNELTLFDPIIELSSTLSELQLASNLLTSFNPTLSLPSSLSILQLGDNLLTSFNPTLSLSSSLVNLFLQNNQITSFNPTQTLPTGLNNLDLSYNDLTNFNPTQALPSGLNTLNLGYNQLTSFNPSQLLPSSLYFLNLANNQLSTTEVNNTLVMLNARYTSPGYKVFNLQMSPSAPPSGAGLTAKAALQAKGYNVLTN